MILLGVSASVIILLIAPRWFVYIVAFVTMTPILGIGAWLATGSSAMRCAVFATPSPPPEVRNDFGVSRENWPPRARPAVSKTFVACGYASVGSRDGNVRVPRDAIEAQPVARPPEAGAPSQWP